MTKKLLTPWVAAFVIALALPNLGRAAEQERPLVVSLVQEIGFVLNPAIGGSAFNLRFLNNLYVGLIDPTDDKTRFRPALADHWEVSDDGTIYSFRLRDDAAWSDGTPISADMVLQSFEQLARLEGGFALFDFSEAEFRLVERDGRDWIVFEIEAPNPAFMAALAVETSSILPVHLADRLDFSQGWGDIDPTRLVYSGPYMLVENGEGHLTLQQNPRYYNQGAVRHAQVIIHKPANGGAGVISMFHEKEVDFAFVSDAGNTSTIERIMPEHMVVDDVNLVDFLMFNSRSGLLQDPEIRLALRLPAAEAYPDQFFEQNWLNRIEGLFSPAIERAYGIEFSSEITNMPREERLAHAVAIMEAKGYSQENPLTLTMTIGDTPFNQRMASLQRSQWSQIHVDLQIEALPFSAFQNRMMKSEFEIARTGWQYDYDHPLAILDLYRSDSMFNFTGHQAPEFDQKLAGLALQSDPEKIALFSTQAMHILDQSNMVVPLFARKDVYLRQPDILLDQPTAGQAVRYLHMISRDKDIAQGAQAGQ